MQTRLVVIVQKVQEDITGFICYVVVMVIVQLVVMIVVVVWWVGCCVVMTGRVLC